MNAEQIAREILHKWLREVAPIAVQMSVHPRHTNPLLSAIATALRSAHEAGFDACKEQAAALAHNFTGAQHAAHDMKTGVFPKQSYMGEAIAASIRSMLPESKA